jgi:hypothetical protein
MLACLAAPVAADETGRLDGVRVSPGRGTTTTTFTFEVTYRDPAGEPAEIRVHVPAGWHAMAPDGTDWRAGVRFRWSSTLPAGRHPVGFSAGAGERTVDWAQGPNLAVEAAPPPPPPPPPTGTPSPPPTPTPAPSTTPARPTAEPTGTATTTTPGPDGAPAPTAEPTASSTASPRPSAMSAAGPPASAGSSSRVHARPTDAPNGGPPDASPAASQPAADPLDGAAAQAPRNQGSDAGSGPSALGGWGDPTGVFAALGLQPTTSWNIRLVPALVSSAGGMTLLMGFMFFGKRRREGEPTAPDEALEADAARPGTAAADASLATAPPPRLEGDLAMPRWRRPSLLEARRADPSRESTPVAPLVFGDGAVPALDGFERRLIRYHVVELLDAPDELRSARTGSLTHGDEVQLLERSGTYWRVLCPNGQQGWVHRMTLGEVVGAAAAPTPAATWGPATLAAGGPDGSLLEAFISARRSA